MQPAVVVIVDMSIFIDDNARPHRSAEVTVFVEVSIRRLDWSARSSDFNPIEHLKDVFKRRF